MTLRAQSQQSWAGPRAIVKHVVADLFDPSSHCPRVTSRSCNLGTISLGRFTDQPGQLNSLMWMGYWTTLPCPTINLGSKNGIMAGSPSDLSQSGITVWKKHNDATQPIGCGCTLCIIEVKGCPLTLSVKLLASFQADPSSSGSTQWLRRCHCAIQPIKFGGTVTSLLANKTSMILKEAKVFWALLKQSPHNCYKVEGAILAAAANGQKIYPLFITILIA